MRKVKALRDRSFKQEICKEVGKDLGIDPLLVQAVVDSVFKETNEQIMNTPVEGDRSLVVRIPHLGSFWSVAPKRHKKLEFQRKEGFKKHLIKKKKKDESNQ